MHCISRARGTKQIRYIDSSTYNCIETLEDSGIKKLNVILFTWMKVNKSFLVFQFKKATWNRIFLDAKYIYTWHIFPLTLRKRELLDIASCGNVKVPKRLGNIIIILFFCNGLGYYKYGRALSPSLSILQVQTNPFVYLFKRFFFIKDGLGLA